VILVIERFWSTLEARDALLSYLHGHADQIIKVKIPLSPQTDDYYHWISDIHSPKTTGNIMSMSRVVSVAQSFTGWPVSGNDEVLLEITDRHCDWNNGVYRLSGVGGCLAVERVEEPCSTSLSVEGLTSLLYGTLGENQMKRLGWLSGDLPSELAEWFPRAVPWLTEEF
jgi:predicted acetyltransferase